MEGKAEMKEEDNSKVVVSALIWGEIFSLPLKRYY